MKHTLPKLPYQYNALEPYIDEQTMLIHHTKHHQAYIDKLNTALESHKDLQSKKVEELLKDLNSIPEAIRTAVRNHGGGHFNHSLFWTILKKDTHFKGKIADNINKTFGSFDSFKEKFSNAAIGLFGSGWAWLVLHNGKLEIVTTPNQDSPVSEGKTPLLGLDLWEHSYYLKYMNKRADYVSAFFNVINWDKVEENFVHAK